MRLNGKFAAFLRQGGGWRVLDLVNGRGRIRHRGSQYG
jgi:hypothetical protein